MYEGKSASRNGGELEVIDGGGGFGVGVVGEIGNEESAGLGDMNG